MKRASDLLKSIADAPSQNQLTVGDFVAMLGDRSFALVILIFSLPNAVPLPGIPGFSTVTGLPILLLALQIMYGRHSIWLPRRIAEKHFPQVFLSKVIMKALPVIKGIEKFIRPRFSFICESKGERVIGLFIALMALILTLPIYGANFLPGLCISLFALALLESDGILAIIGSVLCIISFYLVYELVIFGIESSMQLL